MSDLKTLVTILSDPPTRATTVSPVVLKLISDLSPENPLENWTCLNLGLMQESIISLRHELSRMQPYINEEPTLRTTYMETIKIYTDLVTKIVSQMMKYAQRSANEHE